MRMGIDIKFKIYNPLYNRLYGPYSLEELIKEGVYGISDVYLQYIGLKDKNGIEIYEGDIMRVTIDGEETLHQVIGPDEYYPAFDLKPSIEWIDEINNLSYTVCSDSVDDYQVIGNIYFNSEIGK